MAAIFSQFGSYPVGGVRSTADSLGKVLYVSSTYGRDGGAGTIEDPLATLQKAVSILTSAAQVPQNRGDTIVLLEGHTESITSATYVNLSRDGLHVVGMGVGGRRPTLTLSTVITSVLRISGAGVVLDNVRVVNGIDNLTVGINITGAGCMLRNIETSDNNASFHCDDFIVTSAAAAGLRIKGWKHLASTGNTGAQTALSIVGGSDIEIDDFDIDGNFATAAIENVTTACTTLKIGVHSHGNNYVRTRNAADIAVTLVSTATGAIDNMLIRLQDDAANITECVAPGDCNIGNNVYVANADSERAMQINTTASTDA